MSLKRLAPMCNPAFWLLTLSLVSPHIATAASTVPAPIVIPPSQYWDGNDGLWSTFTLQLGTPAQDVRVLISTASSSTWAVLPQGCLADGPSTCPTSRGGTFLPNTSSTWNFDNYYTLSLETNLFPPPSPSGEWGFETITIGWQGSGGPTLTNQVLAGIATEEFWLGVFGLVPRPTNFTNFNDPKPSFLQNLKNQSMIPSLSWSYTAGAPYRLEKVPGSLVLGGYDASKAGLSNISIAFGPDISRDLTIGLQSITTSFNEHVHSLLSTPIYTLIDSTVPGIWLPIDACREFETQFNLTWDNNTSLYPLNDTQHQALVSQNASFSFLLGNTTSATGNQTINITFPYASFDLMVDYPIVDNKTHYFPIMRAANDTQYTLGRTFLQEAYLTADYEREVFYVSQTDFDPNAKEHIITIPPLNSTLISPISGSSHPIKVGIVITIVVVCVLVGIIFILILFFLNRRKRRAKEEAKRLSTATDKPSPLVEAFGKAELDAGESAGAGEGGRGDKFEIEGVTSPTSTVRPMSEVYEMGGEGIEMRELDTEGPREAMSPTGTEVAVSPLERVFEMRSNEAEATGELPAEMERPHEVE